MGILKYYAAWSRKKQDWFGDTNGYRLHSNVASAALSTSALAISEIVPRKGDRHHRSNRLSGMNLHDDGASPRFAPVNAAL